ncbi:EpsG family protein [Flavobacterium soyangense]|uniref:EpsG family protein n=1 Tax=Flavobacterium soyangense TaxID=2023265 RepID=A0A930U9V8_9FLAO|nr:EpsG family protein [Flavobacterium soyangense]MBF2708187.1 EpsG family protein [Flavobacterium soyangense]
MTPYILLLVLTTLFAYFADLLFKKHHSQSIVFIIGIVVVYTVIAGLRDFGIGIDTNVYIEDYFDTAKSLVSIKDFLTIESMDKGFLFICWISSLISSDKQVVLVVVEFWIIAFTMHGVYMLKKNHGVKLWIFVFLYFFMFFGYSINLMRQFCAMSLLFWGFAWLRKGNWKVYALTQVVAYYFHSSSVVFLIVPIVYFLSSIKNVRFRNYITIASLIVFIFIMSSFIYFLTLFGDFKIVSDVYTDRYGQNSDFNTTAGSSNILLLSYMFEFFLLYIASINKRMPVSYKYILVTLYCINFLLIQLHFITAYLDRLSYYIGLVYMTYLVYVLEDKRINPLLRVTVVCFTIFFSYRIFIENGGAEIYPYTSKILGI